MNNKRKNLQSRELQVDARKGFRPILQHHYSIVKAGNKIVGKVVDDEFVKKVHSLKHFLHTPPAIAFDVDSLNQTRNLDATRVKIFDLDTGIVYRVTIGVILKKGFLFNRGYGDQIGLALKVWTFDKATKTSQLSLWGHQ